MAIYLPHQHLALDIVDDPGNAPVDRSAFPGITVIPILRCELGSRKVSACEGASDGAAALATHHPTVRYSATAPHRKRAAASTAGGVCKASRSANSGQGDARRRRSEQHTGSGHASDAHDTSKANNTDGTCSADGAGDGGIPNEARNGNSSRSVAHAPFTPADIAARKHFFRMLGRTHTGLARALTIASRTGEASPVASAPTGESALKPPPDKTTSAAAMPHDVQPTSHGKAADR